MERTKWTERSFSFEIPMGWMPNILERLQGTVVRIKEITRDVPDEILSRKPIGEWSIKEHIGHLTDLEELHDGRLHDFMARRDTLRAADMDNLKTNEAFHNDKTIQELTDEFILQRKIFLHHLLEIDEATHQFEAMHPRLGVTMRPVDMAFFTAEHDDHHLATIRQLINL